MKTFVLIKLISNKGVRLNPIFYKNIRLTRIREKNPKRGTVTRARWRSQNFTDKGWRSTVDPKRSRVKVYGRYLGMIRYYLRKSASAFFLSNSLNNAETIVQTMLNLTVGIFYISVCFCCLLFIFDIVVKELQHQNFIKNHFRLNYNYTLLMHYGPRVCYILYALLNCIWREEIFKDLENGFGKSRTLVCYRRLIGNLSNKISDSNKKSDTRKLTTLGKVVWPAVDFFGILVTHGNQVVHQHPNIANVINCL